MKDRTLRELMPYVAFAMLVSGSIFADHISATGDVDVKREIVFPKKSSSSEVPTLVELNSGDIAILNMGSHDVTYFNHGKPILQPVTEYEYLTYEKIESITYTNNDLELTIKLKDSDVYYTGKYDKKLKQYVYKKQGETLVETSNQYIKK